MESERAGSYGGVVILRPFRIPVPNSFSGLQKTPQTLVLHAATLDAKGGKWNKNEEKNARSTNKNAESANDIREHEKHTKNTRQTQKRKKRKKPEENKK